MSSIVTIHSGFRISIIDQPFWHLVGPAYAWMFHNNVRVGCGALLSVSATIEGDPLAHGAQTPYSFWKRSDPKEIHFERVRAQRFPSLPTRMKSLFVFDDHALVERAQREWFSSAAKIVYECRVATGSSTHRADAQLLNGSSEKWEENAIAYWSGAMTAEPFPETLVCGTLYFPHWRSFPAA